MTHEEDIWLQIQDYLDGTLEGEELARFELRLRESSELREQVESMVAATELVVDYRVMNVKSLLAKTHTQAVRTRRMLRLMSVFLVLLAAVAIWYWTSRPETHEAMSDSSSPEVAVQKTSPQEKTDFETTTSENSSSKEFIRAEKSKEQTIVATESEIPDLASPVVSERIINETPDEKNTSVAEPAQVKEVAWDCEKDPIQLRLNTKATCLNKQTGAVFLKEIKGGVKPYSMYIVDENGSRTANHIALEAGTYTAEIYDSKKCLVKEKFVITSQRCALDYSFNPGLNEQWEIPDSDVEGHLSIMDPSGKVVFEKIIPAEAHEIWDGQTTYGEAKPGYYQFRIQYRDNTVTTGSVTVVP